MGGDAVIWLYTLLVAAGGFLTAFYAILMAAAGKPGVEHRTGVRVVLTLCAIAVLLPLGLWASAVVP